MAVNKTNRKVKARIKGKVIKNKTSKPGNTHESMDIDIYEDSYSKTTTGNRSDSWDLYNEFTDMDFRLVDD